MACKLHGRLSNRAFCSKLISKKLVNEMRECGMQAITEEVYRLLENQCQLRRVYIPVVFHIYSGLRNALDSSAIFVMAILSLCSAGTRPNAPPDGQEFFHDFLTTISKWSISPACSSPLRSLFLMWPFLYNLSPPDGDGALLPPWGPQSEVSGGDLSLSLCISEPVRVKGGQSVFWSILRFCHK